MLFYTLTWASLMITFWISYSNGTLQKNGLTIALQWTNFIFLVLTFVFMERLLEEKKGKRYAKKHGWIALGLLFVFGIGFIVWPPMMFLKLNTLEPGLPSDER